MKKTQSAQFDVIFFISLLSILILILFGALSYLESKQTDQEEPIVITSNQVQSFLWLLGNYSSNSSLSPSPSSSSSSTSAFSTSSFNNQLLNGTFGYNVDNSSSPITFYSSEVNYSQIDPSKSSQPESVIEKPTADCSFLPQANGGNLLSYLCNSQHVILFSLRNPNYATVNGNLYYSVQLIHSFKSTPLLKKALQREIIILTGNNNINKRNNVAKTVKQQPLISASKFKRDRIYLVTVTLQNNQPLVTNCDLKLDWSTLSYDVKSALLSFFTQSSGYCILNKYRDKLPNTID